MAKKLLGSGSKGRTMSKKTKSGGKRGGPGDVNKHPWQDPEKKAAADNAGGAGRMLSKQLKKNKSRGIKGY